ncbi:uncharacterized protein A4U43_C03F13500 [Asparagus officinalis]|uniref:Uncharacterized protein n=1 Tax=Asparagus officinalis TaxID=4686 RepID=A0A5P1FBJ1_ASPOF|nr:uncharacterized protein A4U43_C03F13500 [Asparagus officinalis]
MNLGGEVAAKLLAEGEHEVASRAGDLREDTVNSGVMVRVVGLRVRLVGGLRWWSVSVAGADFRSSLFGSNLQHEAVAALINNWSCSDSSSVIDFSFFWGLEGANNLCVIFELQCLVQL